MDLLVASIVLLLLFFATYSQRRTWVTLGSTALTIVLVAGGVFVFTAQGSGQVHDGLTRVAKTLPAGWDQPALKLTAAIEQASTSLARAKKDAATREAEPVLTASASKWFDWKSSSGGSWSWGSWSWGSWSQGAWPWDSWSLGAWSWDSWFGTAPDAEDEEESSEARDSPSPAPAASASGAAIKWFLDAPSLSASEAFVVSGANTSDQPLKVVRAVLKPDSGANKLKLTLDVDGHGGAESAVVPPGARFQLKAARLTASEVEKLGGAVLSVAYVQAGRRKSSITYLTPDMLAAQ